MAKCSILSAREGDQSRDQCYDALEQLLRILPGQTPCPLYTSPIPLPPPNSGKCVGCAFFLYEELLWTKILTSVSRKLCVC